MHYKRLVIVISTIILCLIVILLKDTESINKKSIVSIKVKTEYGYDIGYGIVYKINHKTYIVTNNHIIDDGDQIIVEDKYKAQLVNRDLYEDIALLTISDYKHFKVNNFNNNIKINDQVKALDLHSNNNIRGTITHLNKKVPVNLDNVSYLINSIELKMNIEPGHSGSPLYNAQNEIIGMITMTKTDEPATGYAIDIKHVLDIAQKLEKGDLKRPSIGVEVASTSNTQAVSHYELNTYDKEGIIVTKVYDSKYLEVGDIITKINTHKVTDIAHFKYYLFNSTNNIQLEIYRHNQKRIIKVDGNE